jgi:hypothetical protein
MKRYIVALLLMLSALGGYAQQDSIKVASIEEMEQILASGKESVQVYYNLGYAYYKNGELAKSILNFERAHRLAPSDEDIIYNLEQAYAMTDKLQEVEVVFFVRWWNSLCNMMSSDGWAVMFVVVFILMLVGVAAFIFSDNVSLRKAGFFSAAALLVVAIFSLSVSIRQRDNIVNCKDAIIMKASVTLSTSPDENGSELVVLHAGTKVHVLNRLGEWCEVRLKDGNVGWIKASFIEVI